MLTNDQSYVIKVDGSWRVTMASFESPHSHPHPYSHTCPNSVPHPYPHPHPHYYAHKYASLQPGMRIFRYRNICFMPPQSLTTWPPKPPLACSCSYLCFFCRDWSYFYFLLLFFFKFHLFLLLLFFFFSLIVIAPVCWSAHVHVSCLALATV